MATTTTRTTRGHGHGHTARPSDPVRRDDRGPALLAPASIVIPAHNEAGVIARCLESLNEQGRLDRVEVVVVANGCSDDTADIARGFASSMPALRVVELAEGSKIGALNAGDEHCTLFPRIYLDADVELQTGALESLITTLTTTEARVAAPRVDFRTDSSGRVVRAFYEVFRELPYARSDLVGLGVYGLSEGGRRRFEDFPDVIADDLYVQRLFAPEERVVTELGFHVFAPLDARSLVRVRTRVARGNAELARSEEAGPDGTMAATTGSTSTALVQLVLRRPRRVLSVAVYTAVTLAARYRARRPSVTWMRDESSRLLPVSRDLPAGLAAPVAADPVELTGRAPVVIDGVPIDAFTEAEAVEHVVEEIDQGRGGLIVTPNIDILRQLRRGHRALLESASLMVADGMPIIWASRLQGEALPERVTGADLVWSLSRAASRRGQSIFLLGAAPGVAARAGAALAEANPGLRIAGTYSPDLGFDQDSASMDRVADVVAITEPDLVFVALGFPRQEQIALCLRERLPHAWFLGCGGALDMAAGDTVRADPRLQQYGGEWLHRLRLQPRRLARRYLVDDLPYALGLLGRSSLHRLRHSSGRT